MKEFGEYSEENPIIRKKFGCLLTNELNGANFKTFPHQVTADGHRFIALLEIQYISDTNVLYVAYLLSLRTTEDLNGHSATVDLAGMDAIIRTAYQLFKQLE
jgi:hypothetical protein